jgi:hypothetical protein
MNRAACGRSTASPPTQRQSVQLFPPRRPRVGSTGWVLLLLLLQALQLQGEPTGRWNLQVSGSGFAYSGWLEIADDGAKMKVRYVGRVGNVRQITDFKLTENELTFARNEWFGAYEVVQHVFRFDAGRINGEFTRQSGQTLAVAGVPAPSLDRPAPVAWGAPQRLFNGRDLVGWGHTQDRPTANWRVAAGELVTFAGGGDLRTRGVYDDFKLHLEYLCPANGNSGVYLRGRYELQIEDDSPKAPPANQTGGIYGWVAPTIAVPRESDRWHSLDVTLVGRRVSVSIDGVVLYTDAEIPGITGGAIDSDEDAPGPIVLQASHGKARGEVRFRNITVAVPQR